MPLKNRVLLAVILATVAAPGVASAQTAYLTNSIEYLSDSADVVILATVQELSFSPSEFRDPFGDLQTEWVAVTLNVQDTLKGKAPKQVRFVLRRRKGDAVLSGWKADRRKILWFLEDLGPAKRTYPSDFPLQSQGRLAPRELADSPERVLVFDGPDLIGWNVKGILSMDLNLINTVDAAVEAVRREAKLTPKKKDDAVMIDIPWDLAKRTGICGDGNGLILPINPRLAELGREWVRSKDEEPKPGVFPRGAWMRKVGVKALSFFKSDRHIELLKSLLSDPATIGDGNTKETVYWVREAAYKTLIEWGVKVEKPVLRLPPKPLGQSFKT